jgi:hypothetical protein
MNLEYNPDKYAHDIFIYENVSSYEEFLKFGYIVYTNCFLRSNRQHIPQISIVNGDSNYHLETLDGEQIGIIPFNFDIEFNPELYSRDIFQYQNVSNHDDFIQTKCIVWSNCIMLDTGEIYEQISLCSGSDLYNIETNEGDLLGQFRRQDREIKAAVGQKRRR